MQPRNFQNRTASREGVAKWSLGYGYSALLWTVSDYARRTLDR